MFDFNNLDDFHDVSGPDYSDWDDDDYDDTVYYDDYVDIHPHDTYDDIDDGYFSFTEHSEYFDDVDSE